jgi:hypothetical protein
VVWSARYGCDIGTHHEPGNFERLAVLVDAGMEDLNDGRFGGDGEDGDLVGSGHPGRDLLTCLHDVVTELGKPSVDAAGAGIRVGGEHGPLRGAPQDVRDGDLDGFVVEK